MEEDQALCMGVNNAQRFSRLFKNSQIDRQRNSNVESDNIATEPSNKGIRFSPCEYLHTAQSFARVGMELAKESKLV